MHNLNMVRWSQGNGMKYDTNASFFQSIKETNNKQCLKKYISSSVPRMDNCYSQTVGK